MLGRNIFDEGVLPQFKGPCAVVIVISTVLVIVDALIEAVTKAIEILGDGELFEASCIVHDFFDVTSQYRMIRDAAKSFKICGNSQIQH